MRALRLLWDLVVLLATCLIALLIFVVPWAGMAFYAMDLRPWAWEPDWARGLWLPVQFLWACFIYGKMVED